ncbi:hypothetical protein CR513_04822, partial [Mucuna pruriens]
MGRKGVPDGVGQRTPRKGSRHKPPPHLKPNAKLGSNAPFIKLSDLQSLHYWAFERRHGNLLSILEVEVQPVALVALARYYDSPLRYFTFRDFQLAPTLKEYERLLGLPLIESPHYFYRGHYPSWTLVAKLLRVSESKITREKRNRNDLEGIQRSYLEERLHQLQKEEDWPTVMDVYGLVVYGIVLFPHMEDYIDLAAMDVFLAKRENGENPTMAILANIYYILNYCCERKRRSLRCCTHLLYLWMIAHLFHNKRKTTCPIEDFKWSWIRSMSKVRWIEYLDRASKRTIRWYPLWNKREQLIMRCGGFPNVPLMGTEGGIHYNPELTTRQDGYPMI